MDENRLYRVLRDDEDPELNGISAKNPSANRTLQDHVVSGSDVESQFISCSNSRSAAMRFANNRKSHYHIAVLDRVQIEADENIEVKDISDGGGFSTEKAQNFSRRFQEVTLVGNIPKEYVLEVLPI